VTFQGPSRPPTNEWRRGLVVMGCEVLSWAIEWRSGKEEFAARRPRTLLRALRRVEMGVLIMMRNRGLWL
jgi:hypothetical protein